MRIRLPLLLLVALSACSGPSSGGRFASESQRGFWVQAESRALEPTAVVGLWATNDLPGSREPFLLELNADGTYRQGIRVALFPDPASTERRGHEAGAYLVEDGRIVFNAQSGADDVGMTMKGYHCVYWRSLKRSAKTLELGDPNWTDKIRTAIHPSKATYTPTQ